MATQTGIHTAADGLVVSNPEILGGTPVFRGTRVPIKTLFDYLEGGDNLEEFLEDFPTVTHEQATLLLEAAKDSLLVGATST